MSRRVSMPLSIVGMVAAASTVSAQRPDWPQHALDRPRPVVVTPAPIVGPAGPPSDAIVLFDGRGLAEWRSTDSTPTRAGWKASSSAIEVVPGAGGIQTVRAFGDVQLHIEWMSPVLAAGTGQDRGNSGVFLMGRYEVQVLDSYRNTTYADGQAGSIYGQFPPLVNASRPPGRWQSFDIVFRRPSFDDDGRLTVPARMTVLHNGVLVHEDVVLQGPTSHRVRAPYTAHPDRMPISLQDHGHKVRFRNIWVRELPPGAP